MAVLEMCKISICALKKDRKQILELIQRKGCMEINQTKTKDEEWFEKMNTATQVSIFERNAALSENALEILNLYEPEKTSMLSSLAGKDDISLDNYRKISDSQENIMNLVNKIINQKKQIDDLTNANIRWEEEIKSLEPWTSLDVPMKFQGTRTTGFMTGLISGNYNNEQLISKLQTIEGLPESVHIQVISADKYQTYVACVYIKEYEEQLEKALRSLSFAKPPVETAHNPTQSIERRKGWIGANDEKISGIKSLIQKESENREKIKQTADYYRNRAEKYRILGDINQSKYTFFITGFMTKKDGEKIKETLESKYAVAVDLEKPTDGESPVLLQNNGFTEGVEGVVTSFGYPNKSEFDPTSITAFFYYFFFGIMLSDAAYGLMMFIGCFILLKKFPNMAVSMKKSFKMFMYCGISTFVWGLLFGGFFGDAVTVISQTFFGKTVTMPALWFEPIKDPMKMLIYCLGFGIVHLFTGLGLKGYMMLKAKDIKAFICDVVFWYMFLIGLIMMLLPTSLFASLASMTIVFPAWARTLSQVMTIGGMVGILLMAGRRAKNPAKRLMLGAYSLYDTTSWLSDLLSYSRLLALGLATGVIAQVINTMAAMGGKSVVGVILFIVVFIFGHIFNMAINLLGAYVHTNRLQFVEFFGKFYEGGGREFQPFKQNTKYVNVKED